MPTQAAATQQVQCERSCNPDPLFLEVRRADRCINALYNLVLSPCQVKATLYILLRAIAQGGVISQHDLCVQLSASPETLSRRLGSAKAKGLVVMHTGKDRRRYYRLTAAGSELLDKVAPFWQAADRRLRAAFGEHDWEQLVFLCRRIPEVVQWAQIMPMSRSHRPSPAKTE
jgi:DNA-binding MarR family transcriptional regulator